jgi:hypothetical protein
MRLLIRILGLLFVIYAALSVVKGLLGIVAPKRPIRDSSAGRLVKDPACGTYIPESSALRAGDHFFCSEECQRKFLRM